MTLAQKSDRILAQTRGLSGATPNATQLIEELRWALEENRREVERLTTERDEARREVCELLCNPPADEIERLRKERDEAKAEAIRSDLRMADAEFERDEARRLYCESLSTSRHGRKQVAASRNWDCYEENPRGENDEDDANG